ncbi:uncharacterized protein M421DRAFT_96273 [Didymella exigua CBS 183.55]|uniref:Uncharacterized protein n=1 Tax=Didymella exigua CBS 183.55 TaxID=1150837 RepID=A0A6A5RBR0_9PLEO|nr:uncharacterized protein M421DRAFT_96273 [Didymella exigua CBS 183.55]KAF1923237.1 hypothetical protein M421DRAFT_96273 [Didymella exigua CBS 183.55]
MAKCWNVVHCSCADIHLAELSIFVGGCYGIASSLLKRAFVHAVLFESHEAIKTHDFKKSTPQRERYYPYSRTTNSDGSLVLGSTSGSYWYSQFDNSGCYNANTVNATGIQLSVAAPAGTTFRVTMRWKIDEECTTLSPPSSVPITSFVTFTSADAYQVAQIPFADFSGMNTSRLDSVALSAFNPSDVDVKVGCTSLINVAATPSLQTCNCPDDAWLNYCTPGVANRNNRGYVQSDDGTMEVAPVVTDGALVLQPSITGSYWYSLQNCADVPASQYLVLNVTASAGASFNVQLQSGGFGCHGQTAIQRLSVATCAEDTAE